MKKKLLFFILLSVVGVVSSFADTWTDSNGVTWTYYVRTYNGVTGAAIKAVANCPAEVTVPKYVGNMDAIQTVRWIGFPGSTYADCAPFKNNQSIISVELPKSVIGIEYDVFNGCSNLQSINLSSCTNIGQNAFSNCSSLEEIDLSSCVELGANAFYKCESLSSVGSLENCTSIPYGAFQNCSSLTSIGDLNKCTSVGTYAFANCSSLGSIGNLPVCVTIASGAFSEDYYLTSIGEMPSCTSIGNSAFYSCRFPVLTLGHETTIANSSSTTIPLGTRILVPAEDVEAYKNADNWSDIAERILSKDDQHEWNITITETPVTGSALQNAIGDNDLSNVMKLKITGNINSYDFFVMRNKMINLQFVDFSDARVVESDYVYYNGRKTKNDIFPEYCFYEQYKFYEIIFPRSIKSIGNYALYGCGSLNTIKMFSGLETIGYNSFARCRIQELVIPESVTELGSSAFEQNGILKAVTFSPKLTYIGNSCFRGCGNLISINLPSRVTGIGSLAFCECSRLKDVTLPSALRSIGSGAFSACYNLKVVKTTAIDPNSVSMYSDSFADYAGKTLYIPYDEETDWDATYEAYYWHDTWGQFGTLATWTPNYDNVNVGGDYNQNKGTIPGVNIGANFGNNAGYHLGQYAKQGFDKMKIKHDGKDGASIIADKDNLTANELTCDIDVVANKWYFFCFPFDVNISQIQAPGESVWRKYNAAVRASNGNGGWQKLGSDDKTLKAGQGYIFQCNTAGTLVITISDPDFKADNKSPQLEEHVADNAQDASWNFVGNPFLSYYELADLGHDAPVTIWTGNGYEAVRPRDDDYALQPFQAFFVQKTAGSDEVTVDKDKRETKQQSEKKVKAAKARRAKQAINPDRLLINLEMTDGETIDKTRVVFNDRQQMDYEPECDAAKFMSTEQVPQLYTYYNNVNYAINERPNRDTEVRLAFKAPKAGEYTISATRMDTPMLLKDTELGITFDFQTGSYTFESKAGTNDKRFILVKNNTETAIQPVTIGDAESAEFFNLAGQKTSANAKGVVISNGKKLLKK